MTVSPRPSRRSLLRVAAIVPVLGGLSVTGAVSSIGPRLSSCAQAATASHVALVVEHGDGAVISVCVAFTGASITGDQVLSDARAQAQLEYATASYGGGNGEAVCQIDQEPASYPPGCWTASSPYWALYVSRGGGAWASSSLGISSQTFRDGDAEGFRYEAQSDNSTPPSPRGVCPATTISTATPATAATTAAATARAAPRSPSPTASVAIAAATPTLGAAASPSAGPTANGPTPRGSVAALSRSPPPPPGSVSAGAWTASALGAGLLLLFVVQLVRARRGTSVPPPPV